MNGPEPVRANIVNVFSGEQYEVLANPTEIEEVRRVNWSQPRVPGLSHRPAHYSGSENATFNFRLWIDRHIAAHRGGRFDVDDFANFCRAFTVPPVHNGEVASGPPQLLFVWGKWSFLTRVHSLSLRFTEFAVSGEPIRYDATFTLSQVNVDRVSSERLRFAGDQA